MTDLGPEVDERTLRRVFGGRRSTDTISRGPERRVSTSRESFERKRNLVMNDGNRGYQERLHTCELMDKIEAGTNED